jgi:hypothetical protein
MEVNALIYSLSKTNDIWYNIFPKKKKRFVLNGKIF